MTGNENSSLELSAQVTLKVYIFAKKDTWNDNKYGLLKYQFIIYQNSKLTVWKTGNILNFSHLV